MQEYRLPVNVSAHHGEVHQDALVVQKICLALLHYDTGFVQARRGPSLVPLRDQIVAEIPDSSITAALLPVRVAVFFVVVVATTHISIDISIVVVGPARKDLEHLGVASQNLVRKEKKHVFVAAAARVLLCHE